MSRVKSKGCDGVCVGFYVGARWSGGVALVPGDWLIGCMEWGRG